ncbi:MAG: hypothetical protein MRY80_11625 [Oricola sp.]|nr:hypothetical protein [Oricola sp.]
MKAYDKLPPSVRETMRNALMDWATQPYVTARRRDGIGANQLSDMIMRDDMSAARKDAKKDFGDQAADFLAAQPSRRKRDWFDSPPKRKAR